MIYKLKSVDEVCDKIIQLNKNNPECEVIIPGKGKFKITLQQEDSKSIREDILTDPSIGKMIDASREAYRNQDYLTTKELIQKIKEKDFDNDEE